ncbi:MAG: radical SAM protein [Bacteroidales bacterium]|nr:radical SAM protein [Bacteroidales bacterium]
MKQKHVNIPIFFPQRSCPHQCVFCNQQHISSRVHIPSTKEITHSIEQYLHTIPPETEVQIAFFGGTFTAMPLSEQEEYLQLVQPYIRSGRVQSIRISTRPDYIDNETLALLKHYSVLDIELGAQSTNDEVLRQSGRGHTQADIVNAATLIRRAGFRLGLQMMIGLPGDSAQRALHTAQTICDLGAHSTRIYPTLVVAHTPLAELWRKELYTPLSLEDALAWTAPVYQNFEQRGVQVLRVGLHPSSDLSNGALLAGPYHSSFKELLLSYVWLHIFKTNVQKSYETIHIEVAPAQLNFAIGHGGSNRKFLQTIAKHVVITAHAELSGYEFRMC